MQYLDCKPVVLSEAQWDSLPDRAKDGKDRQLYVLFFNTERVALWRPVTIKSK